MYCAVRFSDIEYEHEYKNKQQTRHQSKGGENVQSQKRVYPARRHNAGRMDNQNGAGHCDRFACFSGVSRECNVLC